MMEKNNPKGQHTQSVRACTLQLCGLSYNGHKNVTELFLGPFLGRRNEKRKEERKEENGKGKKRKDSARRVPAWPELK